MWNPDLVIDANKLGSLNRQPVEITEDQLIQLYIMLYPMIITEFVHKADFVAYINAMKAEFEAQIQSLNSQLAALTLNYNNHIHTTPSGPAAPIPILSQASAPSLTGWTVSPVDPQFSLGEKLITFFSQYSSKIEHRLPLTDLPNTGTSRKISELFNKRFKYVPFDIEEMGESMAPDSFANGII